MKIVKINFFLFICFLFTLSLNSKDISNFWIFFKDKNFNLRNIDNIIKNGKKISLPHKYFNLFSSKNIFYIKKIRDYELKNIKEPAIFLGNIFTSAEVYFNGKKIFTIGCIGERFVDITKKTIFFRIPKNLIKKDNYIVIKNQSSLITGGLFRGPYLIESYDKILNIANSIENKERIKDFFIIGGLFVIFLFCILMYFNGIVDKEYIWFGVFILCCLFYFFLDSLFFYDTGYKSHFLQKLYFVSMFFLPILLLIFMYNVSKVKILGFLKYFIFFIFIFLGFYLFSKDSLKNLLIIKIFWIIIVFLSIYLILKNSYKAYKTENLPELINGIIGVIIFGIFYLIDIIGILPENGFKIGIILFIFCAINGLTKRFSRLNSELKEFSMKLIKARDNERQKLGKELHDGLGQLLIATKLNLQILSKKNKDIFNKIIDEISIALNELRSICENLKPAILDSMGLGYAIRYYLEKYGKGFKIDFKNELKNEENLSSHIKENIFRIFQECLNNAIKHSKATVLNILLKKEKNYLIFIFKDNGKGFDSKNNKNGIGLLSIKERVAILNGTIDIKSFISKGVEIYVKIPLIQEQD